MSNVGYNATMLDQDGQLTDIGSWYLGGKATGNVPEKSAAGRVGGMGACGVGILVLLAGGWLL